MKSVILALLLLAAAPSAAAEIPVARPVPGQPVPAPAPPANELHVPCWVIHSYVWAHGEAAAIAWAVKNGYTPAQINSIRARCVVR